MDGLFEDYTQTQEMESTNKKTAEQHGWLHYRKDRQLQPDERIFAFTDGSSSGYYSAAIIYPRCEYLRLVNGHKAPTSTKNVGAELNGLLLALRTVPENTKVTVVSDYMGIGGWMIGAWFINEPEVEERIAEAHRIATEKNLLGSLRYIHHKGHQRDDSPFTLWNTVADRLCVSKPPWPLDCAIPWPELEVYKDQLNKRDKAAMRIMADAGEKGRRPTHWRVVAKPKWRCWYDWADPATDKYGQCMLALDGSWHQAPLGENPIILAHVGARRKTPAA